MKDGCSRLMGEEGGFRRLLAEHSICSSQGRWGPELNYSLGHGCLTEMVKGPQIRSAVLIPNRPFTNGSAVQPRELSGKETEKWGKCVFSNTQSHFLREIKSNHK